MNKIINFYVKVFSTIGRFCKRIINYNRNLISSAIDDWGNQYYNRSIRKFVIISGLIIFEVFAALVLIILYLMCKLTGICLII